MSFVSLHKHSPGHVHTWPLEKSMGRSRGSPTQGPLWGRPAGAPACPDPSQHTLAHPCPVPPQPRTFSPDPSFCHVLLSQATTFLLSPYPSGFTVVILFATLSSFNSSSSFPPQSVILQFSWEKQKNRKKTPLQGLWDVLSLWLNTPDACQTSENTQIATGIISFPPLSTLKPGYLWLNYTLSE